ncbi:uncharacterized protein MONBRDRAFT_7547 [Monosiga brevicollis MX1]|uniref:DM2 domain-containing protein n=1 Tax=Monosiga brevicollis TaxID=81824 RepID=A9UXB6_MONBE|nr:uncharacterized protein MONBRDRAFT_7547 [Monosiga brevicollis MX1]EDQ90360.1 predicted protein [Monosiga brevicollis MX1]|eukprot:XP_001745127.1 hypothetical protein [Monosiga brevicollis MX1]
MEKEMPSDDVVRAAVLEALRKPGRTLQTTSRKDIRREVEAALGGINLKPRKDLISQVVADFIQQLPPEATAGAEPPVASAAPIKAEPTTLPAPTTTKASPASKDKLPAAKPKLEQEALSDDDPEHELDLTVRAYVPGANVTGSKYVNPDEISDSDLEDDMPAPLKRKSVPERPSASASPRKTKPKATTSHSQASNRTKSAVDPADLTGNSAWSVGEMSDLDRRNAGKTAYNYEHELSEGLAKFMGRPTATRADGTYSLDENLSSALGRKTLTFKSLQKALSANMKKYYKPEPLAVRQMVHDSDDDDDDEHDKPAVPSKKRAKTVASNSSKSATEQKKTTKKAPKKDGRLKQLSSVLAVVVGCAEETRPQVVSKLWTYIRGHNLQNPDKKREILCDEALRAVFKKQAKFAKLYAPQCSQAPDRHDMPNVRQTRRA